MSFYTAAVSIMRSDIIAQINIERLMHNCNTIRALCGPNVRLCATMKGNAYGHGIAIVAPTLQACGVDFAAVATLQESVELRNAKWQHPILVLGNVLAVPDERELRERVRAVVKHHVALTIGDKATIATLARHELAAPIEVHIKVDTGMGRLGCLPSDAAGLVAACRRSPNLRITGIFSHFATADEPNPEYAHKQIAAFRDILDQLKNDLPPGTIRHMANSAATLSLPESHFDMVRPGIAFYGYHSSSHLAEYATLLPSMRVVSHVTAVKELPEGAGVGYGLTYRTRRKTRIGIIPIGYCDGYPRALSNATVVSTPGGDVPVIGRVSMDQIAVDMTDRQELRLGSEIVLITDEPDRPNSVATLARQLGTIPYEITCLLGQRIQRRPVGNPRAVVGSVSSHN